MRFMYVQFVANTILKKIIMSVYVFNSTTPHLTFWFFNNLGQNKQININHCFKIYFVLISKREKNPRKIKCFKFNKAAE